MSLQPVYRVMNKLMKLYVYAAMAAGLALSPIAAHAQTSPTGNTGVTTTTTSDATGTNARGERDDHRDWGWIGLAGLLGLLGLMRRDRRDRNETASNATRRSDQAGTVVNWWAVFAFFSSRLGCVGSSLVSLVATIQLAALLRGCSGGAQW
jgi:hypothetical protein